MRIVRLPGARDRRVHSLPRGMTALGDAAVCQITLNACYLLVRLKYIENSSNTSAFVCYMSCYVWQIVYVSLSVLLLFGFCVIGTARIACGTGSMYRSGVRPSVRLFACRSTAAAAAGGFAAERPAGRRYRSIAAGAGAAYQLHARSAANAGSVTLKADGRGSCNTYLFRLLQVYATTVSNAA